MLKRASCPSCGTSLPLGPKVLSLNLPPRITMCSKCATVMNTTFAYRATWLQSLLWKVLTVLAFGTGVFSLFITYEELPPIMFLFVPLVALFFGALAAFIAAMIAAPPLQIIIDVISWLVRKVTGANGARTQDVSPA